MTTPTGAVERILRWLGEDPDREGLEDTPARVLRALREMTRGYGEDPAEILSTTFDPDGYDEMIVVDGIRFTSLCEHHVLPFQGRASVGYIPGSRVVGLSKIPRLVHCFARRLQIQERMTSEIARSLHLHLSPLGVGVVVNARHECMACRGVREQEATMVTSAMLGVMRGDPSAREEFLSLSRSVTSWAGG